MSDRPPLPAISWEHIELAAKRLDAKYWSILESYQIAYSGPKTLSPAKTPGIVLGVLKMYAGDLLLLEEPNYPKDDPKYALWVGALFARITARIVHTFDEVEALEGDAKLSYHGLTKKEVQQELRAFFAAIAGGNDQGVAIIEVEPARGGAPAGDGDTEIARRLALLAEYKAATNNVSNKRIYEARNSRIHKPEFYRWVSGDLPAKSAPARNFERFLRAKKLPVARKLKP